MSASSMTTKGRIVGALLYAYPAAWRKEYGAELADLLLSQPLGPRVVADVLFGGLWQRARTAEPWVILGSAALVFFIAELFWGFPGTSGNQGVFGLVRPSGITFPTFKVAAMESDYYALLLIACGAWTELRHPCRRFEAGRAAVKMSLLAGSPIIIAGVLAIAAVRTGSPSFLEVASAPILMLPMHWVYGYMGGAFGRWVRSFTRWIAGRLTLSS